MKMHRRTTVGLKLLMLFVAVCTFLISPVSALAQQAERDSILNNGVSHVASWAFYTESCGLPICQRWYISQITAGKIGVYSLGPIVNHNAGWWTVGSSAARVGLSDITISVDSNLDLDPLDWFYDIGLQKWLSDSRIHSDRQLIQGDKVPIKWFFFNVPIGSGNWYILNAPGYGSSTVISKFNELNGRYDWKKTDTTDFVPVFSNSSDGGIHVSFITEEDEDWVSQRKVAAALFREDLTGCGQNSVAGYQAGTCSVMYNYNLSGMPGCFETEKSNYVKDHIGYYQGVNPILS